jgi:hypothetical protein
VSTGFIGLTDRRVIIQDRPSVWEAGRHHVVPYSKVVTDVNARMARKDRQDQWLFFALGLAAAVPAQLAADRTARLT